MPRPHRVAILAFDPFPPFELSVACEVFGMDRRDMGVPLSEVRVVAGVPAPLHAKGAGFTIDTPYGLETLRWADTVIVPGWYSKERGPEEPVLDALRKAYARGARVASFCSGAYVLAYAGLLDGRRATTHWVYAADFAERFPQIDVDPDVLYVGDDRVFTSAGTAAGIDLCLHMVRLDHGAEVANIVARRMVVPPHRDGGQAQFIEAPMPPRCDDDGLADALAWAVEHLDEVITVESLARRARLSPRTFARRFKASSGTTPLQWLLQQRVVLAQRLLETTELPVEVIAQRCGLGSAANLRLHFGRALGTSPNAYRFAFRCAS
jgi:transcriptional regulator GlxA family with amidase domain